MRVDFPAPFSPQIAWISPRWTARLTFESALTPGKVLVIPRISRMVSLTSPTSLWGGWFPGCGGGSCSLPPPFPRIGGCRGSETELLGGPVAGVDERGLHVVLHDGNRCQQERGHDLHVVVVGLGVVDLGLLALQGSGSHVRGNLR